MDSKVKLRGTHEDKRLHNAEINISRLIGCGTSHEGPTVTGCKACQKKLRARQKRSAK